MNDEALLQHALIKAREHYLYKNLTKRTFRQHHGYPNFKAVASTIALSVMCSNSGVAPRLFKEDKTYTNAIMACWLFCHDPTFPVYAIRKDLIEHIQHQKMPRNINRLEKIFDIGMFLLPQGLIVNPDGFSLDWILIIHFDNSDFSQSIEKLCKYSEKETGIPADVEIRVSEGQRKIMWVSSLNNSCFYNNTLELKSRGKPVVGEFEFFGNATGRNNVSAERKFTDAIDNLVLQTLWHMQQPREVIAPTNIGSSSTTPQHHGFSKNSPLEPRWVGLDTPPIILRKTHQGGTHATPIEHTRSGHLRRQRYGKGRQQVKLIHVRPTIVNKRKDETIN